MLVYNVSNCGYCEMKFMNLTASNFVWNPQKTTLVISWPLSKTNHSKRESNPHRITITVQWLLLLLIILLKSLTKTELRVKKRSFRKKFFVFFFFYYLADKTLPFAQNKAIVLSLRNG